MMRRHVVVTVLALLGVVAAMPAGAQNAPDSARRGQGRGMMAAEALMEGIALSDSQQVRVKEISAAFGARRDSLRSRMEPGTRPDSATRAAMMTLMTEERAALRAALTAEQQKQFDANVARWQERRRQMRRPNGGL